MKSNRPQIQVRGVSALDAPATRGVRAAAFIVDAAWTLALYSFCVKIFSLSPVPSLWRVLLALALATVACLAQQGIFSGTLGQRLWKLRLLQLRPDGTKRVLRWTDTLTPRGLPYWWRSGVFQQEKLDVPGSTTAAFITAITVFGSMWIVREAFWKHPLLAQADRWQLEGFVPPPESSGEWNITPYFFSLGAWPKRFGGGPVLYTLPYEKGPPGQYVGHIVSRWEMPGVKVTAEGPRTPAGLQKQSVEQLRSCLLSPWKFECLSIRETALNRHIQEMRKIAPKEWTLRWFEVDNTALPEAERPQGFFLSGRNETRAQDRFVLITPIGQHQAFILDRSLDERGEKARELFEQALRSQRISADLGPGRAWAERRLQEVRLDDLKKLDGDPMAAVARISEIQSLLLSKASVDPRDYEAFFHLGGTAMLILRHSTQTRGGELRTEWSAAAKPTLLAAIRYAQDIAPSDPRTRQLQKMWLDFNK